MNADGWQSAEAGRIRLALLFLTRGDLMLPELWAEFFAGSEDKVPTFLHVKHPEQVRSAVLKRCERVPTLPTEWGGISLVRATLRLLVAALEDRDATHFALVSESCVPVKPLAEIFQRLALDRRSRIAWGGPGEMSLAHYRRVEKAIGVPPACWRSHHQWMVLDREAAGWATEEDRTAQFEGVFAPDEHYFATLLAMMGFPLEERVRKARSTWVDWRDGALTTWSGTDPQLALTLREDPAFFARKFAAESDIGQWRLHRGGDPSPTAPDGGRTRGPCRRKQASRLLVMVCSCRAAVDKRQVCRETWAATPPAGVTVRFVTGGGAIAGETDTIGLPVDDTDGALPSKVMASLRHVVANWECDWIFTCDDHTYVDLDRLHELAREGTGLVVDADFWERGTANDRAGSLLSMEAAEKLMNGRRNPPHGAENALIAKEALRLGARVEATNRLRAGAPPYPRMDNDLITAHLRNHEWMRAVHTLRHTLPVREWHVRHAEWRDILLVHEDGTFARKGGYCAGRLDSDELGDILRWMDWRPERLAEPGGEAGVDFRVVGMDLPRAQDKLAGEGSVDGDLDSTRRQQGESDQGVFVPGTAEGEEEKENREGRSRQVMAGGEDRVVRPRIGESGGHPVAGVCEKEDFRTAAGPCEEKCPIWLYWEGPEPAWITLCRESIRAHGHDVRLLNFDGFANGLWRDDTDLPIESLCVAHQADYIRAYLLAHYGGMWLDSDCVVMKSLLPFQESIRHWDFIYYRQQDGALSNGFMVARSGSQTAVEYYEAVIGRLRAKMNLEWTDIGAKALSSAVNRVDVPRLQVATELVCPIPWNRSDLFLEQREHHSESFNTGAIVYMLFNRMLSARGGAAEDLLRPRSFFSFLLAQSRRNATHRDGSCGECIGETA